MSTPTSNDQSCAQVLDRPSPGVYRATGERAEIEEALARVTLDRDPLPAPPDTDEEVRRALARVIVRRDPRISQPLGTADELAEALARLGANPNPARQRGPSRSELAKLTGAGLLIAVGSALQASVPTDFDSITRVTGFVADLAAIAAVLSAGRGLLHRH